MHHFYKHLSGVLAFQKEHKQNLMTFSHKFRLFTESLIGERRVTMKLSLKVIYIGYTHKMKHGSRDQLQKKNSFECQIKKL